MPENHKGFIALTSIMLLSVLLFATTLSLAQFGIANRSFLLDLEHKARSKKLAEACVHIARIAAFNDPLYRAEMRTMAVGEETCSLVAVVPEAELSLIEARGVSGNAVTNLRVRIHNPTGEFVSWEEVVSFEI